MHCLGHLAGRRRQLRLQGKPGGFTGLPVMPELLHRPVKPLQPKRLAVKKQYGVVVFIVLAVPLEQNIGLSQLVILKFHRDSIVFGFLQRPRLRLVDRRRFKLICEKIKIKINGIESDWFSRETNMAVAKEKKAYIVRCSTCWKTRL